MSNKIIIGVLVDGEYVNKDVSECTEAQINEFVLRMPEAATELIVQLSRRLTACKLGGSKE